MAYALRIDAGATIDPCRDSDVATHDDRRPQGRASGFGELIGEDLKRAMPLQHGSTAGASGMLAATANADSIQHVVDARKYTRTQQRIVWYLLGRLRKAEPWQTYVSVPQHVIAARLGVDRRSVIRALARLQGDGIVTRRHQPIPGGGRRPDLIEIRRNAVNLMGAESDKCHIRKPAKCHIRSTSLPVNRSFETTTDVVDGKQPSDTETRSTMQGRLFTGRGVKRFEDPNADTPKNRLRIFQEAYRAKYDRPAMIPNIAIVLALLKRWQAHLPTLQHWRATVDLYLLQSDMAISRAEHPILWLSRRLPALMPSVLAEVEEQQRQARIAAEAAAQAAQRGTQPRPGMRPGETVEQWKARMIEAKARRRAKEEAARRWA